MMAPKRTYTPKHKAVLSPAVRSNDVRPVPVCMCVFGSFCGIVGGACGNLFSTTVSADWFRFPGKVAKCNVSVGFYYDIESCSPTASSACSQDGLSFDWVFRLASPGRVAVARYLACCRCYSIHTRAIPPHWMPGLPISSARTIQPHACVPTTRPCVGAPTAARTAAKVQHTPPPLRH